MSADPLVQFLEHRDQASFAALVARTRNDVLRAAYRVLGDRDAAEDVTQDVFLKCLNPPWTADEVRSGRALLTATAVNLAKMRIRGDVRRRAREDVVAQPFDATHESGAEDGLRRDEIEHVRFAVAELPEGLRRPVELRYFGGLQLAELARALDVSLSTAKERLQQARALLRARLSDARYGVTLTFVAAESQTSGIAEIQPTQALLGKLDRLATEGVALSGIVAQPAASWWQRYGKRWSAPAAMVALVLALGSGVWMALGGGGGGSEGGGEVAAVAPADDGDGRAQREHDERRRVTVDRSAADAAATGNAAPNDDAEPDDEAAAPDAEALTISLQVEVVDEAGNFIRDGHASLDLAGLPDFALMERLARWKSLLEPQALAAANPILIEGLPDFADGVEIEGTATVPGFAPARTRTTTLRVGARATIRVVVVPERDATLVVVDSVSGAVIPAAEILFLTELDRRDIDEGAPPAALGPGLGLTDATGRVVVTGLGEGPHEVEIRAPGYVARVVEDVPLRSETVIKLVRLRESGTIVVEVLAPNGKPAVGQRVNLNVSGRDTDIVGTIDLTGRVRFENVPIGSQLVMLEIEDWIEHMLNGTTTSDRSVNMQRIEVVADGEYLARLGFLPPAAPLTVEVVGADGKPRAGANVEIYGPLLQEAVTDAAGRAVFEALPAGSYSVHLASGSDPWDWTIARDVEIATGVPGHARVVAGDLHVSGRVVLLASGAPAGGVAVFVSDASGRFLMQWTAADGKFAFGGALAGALSIRFAAGGDLISQIVSVDVPATGDPEPLQVKLRLGGSLRVHRPASESATYRVRIGPEEARDLRTADDGSLRVRGLPAGTVTLEIVRDGKVVGTRDVSIRLREETVIDLR